MKKDPTRQKFRPQTFIFLFFLLVVTSAFTGYSQGDPLWEKYKLDDFVTLTLPGKMDTSIIYGRVTIGRLEYDSLIFTYTKIDVIDSIPWATDTSVLRTNYDKFIKGFLNKNPGTVVEKRIIS